MHSINILWCDITLINNTYKSLKIILCYQNEYGVNEWDGGVV